MLWNFFVLSTPPCAFISELFIQAPLSIVSFCVRDVFNFHLMDGEELLAICTHMIQYFVSINIAFLGVLTLISLLSFNSWHGIIYI